MIEPGSSAIAAPAPEPSTRGMNRNPAVAFPSIRPATRWPSGRSSASPPDWPWARADSRNASRQRRGQD